MVSWVLKIPNTTIWTWIPLIVALSVAKVLNRNYLVPSKIKWPNDLYVDGKKLAGILCEGFSPTAKEPYVIAGLGLNILGSPKIENYPTTCLKEFLATPPEAKVLLSEIQAQLLLDIEPLTQGISPYETSLINEYNHYSLFKKGDVVQWVSKNGTEMGTFVGLGIFGQMMTAIGPPHSQKTIELFSEEVSVRPQL